MPVLPGASAHGRFVRIVVSLALSIAATHAAHAEDRSEKPISHAEALAFGDSIATAVEDADLTTLLQLIDWDALVQKSMANVNAPESVRRSWLQGSVNAIRQPNSFANRIISDVSNGYRFTMLRTRQRDGQQTVLFRMVAPKFRGLNYLEYLLARDKAGKIRSNDYYSFIDGELYSDTLRHRYLRAVANQDRGFFSRLAGRDQEVIKAFSKMPEITQKMAAGQNAEAIAACDALPQSAQNDKAFLLLRIQIASNLGAKTHAAAIERFMKLFPNDASIDFLSIQAYTYSKQTDKALAAIDRLDKAVGGDGYLNVVRSAMMVVADKPREARNFVALAVETSPEMIEAYWLLLSYELKQNDHPAVLATLKKLDQAFDIPLGDLTATPAYSGFLKSPQYAQWLAYLKSRENIAKPSP